MRETVGDETREGSLTLTGDVSAANAEFADLVLSGGVFLGGTAAGNELDDYEEGTWTPTVTAQTGSFTTITINDAHYTRVGRVVTAFVEWTITSVGTASGWMNVTMPFTVDSEISRMFAGSRRINDAVFLHGYLNPATDIVFGIVKQDGSSAIVDGNLYALTATYFTDA